MSGHQSTWLNLSIFYTQAEWHHLLRNCLLPLSCLHKESQSVSSFLIFLNREQGDNIRLSVLCEPTCLREVAGEMSRTIWKFLDRHPSVTPSEIKGSKAFFMSFPNNSLHYNVFYPTEFRLPVEAQYRDGNLSRSLDGRLSVLLFHVLSGDVIDTETLFSFSLYLAWSQVKRMFPDRTDAVEAVDRLLQESRRTSGLYDQHSGRELAVWTQLFNDNAEVFTEICREVWSTDARGPEIKWLEEWQQELPAPMPGSFWLGFSVLVRLIYAHLGLKWVDGPPTGILQMLHQSLQSYLPLNRLSSSTFSSGSTA